MAGDTLETIIQNATMRTNAYIDYMDNIAEDLNTYLESDFESDAPIKVAPIDPLDIPGKRLDDFNIYDGMDEPDFPSSISFPLYGFNNAISEVLFQDPSNSVDVDNNGAYSVNNKPVIRPDLEVVDTPTSIEASSYFKKDMRDLFNIMSPSIEVKTFDESLPESIFPSLVSAISGLTAPESLDKEMPTITAYNLGDTPAVDLPGYDQLYLADDRPDPGDYAAKMDSAYQSMLPEMQSFVDGKVNEFINQYAPEYYEWTTAVQNKITSYLNGSSTALPDQLESVMMTRARARAEQEFAAIDAGLINSFQRSGMMEPPGTVRSQQFTTRLKLADSLANQSSDIYIERRKSEVQNMQFVLNLASAQIQGVRGQVINYAGMLANTIQLASAYAVASADKMAQVFNHLIARSQLSISVLAELRAQYETRLKQSLSVLEKFKIEQEALKLRNDIELSQFQVIDEKIKIQELDIKQYQTLIDAVVHEAEIESMNIKYLETKSSIVKQNADIIALGASVYNAALNGDKTKMEGERERLAIAEGLLKFDEMNFDNQMKSLKAKDFYNDMLIKKYDLEFKDLEQRQDIKEKYWNIQTKIYNQVKQDYELNYKIYLDRYNKFMDQPKILIEQAKMNYQHEVNRKMEEAKLVLGKLQLAAHAREQHVNGMQNIASSAVAATNVLASQAIQAAA